jgi:hypothetical protein
MKNILKIIREEAEKHVNNTGDTISDCKMEENIFLAEEVVFIEKWNQSKIDYVRNIFKMNISKSKFGLKLLDVIENKQDGNVTQKQKIEIERCLRGECGNINLSTKN